jgi:hypothetical protein
MARKAAQTSAATTTETQTEAQGSEQPATGTQAAKTRAPKKAPKVLFEAAVDKIKTALGELLIPRYASVGEEFRKCIEDAQPLINTALGLAQGLPADWKPSGKGTRKRKAFVMGEFVKAKQKSLESFKEMGLGAGPFKVLGVFSSNDTIKLQVEDGSAYVQQREVERVTAPAAPATTVPANE